MVLKEDIARIVRDDNINWERLRNASVLVTGATGLLGSLCVKTLLALPFPVRVYALVRDREKAEAQLGSRVHYVTGDVRKATQEEPAPEFIIHCASVTKSETMLKSPVDTMDISILGTRNMLELAHRCGTKSMVYLSSMEAYGVTEEQQNPVTEEKLGYVDLTAARSSYPEAKRAAECFCAAFYHQYGLPVKIARLSLTMGAGVPLSDNRVSMQFARSAIGGQDIVLHTAGQSQSNFCYTSDSVRGIFTILLNGKDGETYNVCNDKETRRICQIAALVAEQIAGGAIHVVYDIPEGNRFGYAPDAALKLSSQKLMALGWTPEVDLADAYGRLIRYIKGE